MVENAEYRTPGQLIQALLDARGWSQRVLAVVLKADETGINKIIAGKRPVDAELALSLSQIFGVTPERFMDLQKSYDLAQARLLFMDDPELETRAQLFGALPVADMMRRGWLDADDVKNFPKVETAIAKFYGVQTIREIEVFPHAAKKTNVFTPATHTQIAWLYRVREIASEMLTARYSASAVEGERAGTGTNVPDEERVLVRARTCAVVRKNDMFMRLRISDLRFRIWDWASP